MKMNLGKKSKSVIAIYAIILVVYIIGFLIIPFNKIAASWISFAFTIIAIAASLFVFNQAFNSKETLVSKIYGYPIFRVGAVYALAQLAIGIVICAIGAFVAVPYWVALLLSIIMLGAAAIGVIITDNTRDLVEHVDETVKVDTEVVTNFQINIAGIVDCCEDSNLKLELEKLNDAWVQGCYYLGEWHYHPNSLPTPSLTDLNQMRILATDEKLNCPEPILLIIGERDYIWEMHVEICCKTKYIRLLQI